MYDVIIVGGASAGLAAAILHLKAGAQNPSTYKRY
jgi:thioredoxin reductase